MKQAIILILFSCLTKPAISQTAPQKLIQNVEIFSKIISGERALSSIKFFQKYWRHGGNQDFNLCMDYIASALNAAGYNYAGERFKVTVVDAQIDGEYSWQPLMAELRIIAPFDTLLHSLELAKMALCINSHSTPINGITAELVKIDDSLSIISGSLKNKIVYTVKPPKTVFKKAIVAGGAVGMISSYLPFYNRPQENQLSISMDEIPYIDSLSTFGFKISYRTARLLDSLLLKGPVQAHARVVTQFQPKKVREVTAEVIGSIEPQESIALIAHVDEPGANDNASGAAALMEIAFVLRDIFLSKELSWPKRTIKMMWVEEIATVKRWKKMAPQEFEQVKSAIVLDMVGENIALTGGSFLIEKNPDPSAIWTRPPDAHTEWGASEVRESELKGNYLNDLFHSACLIRSELVGWQVRTNPFEGGSDHVPFIRNGIPAVLAWHFTDTFYHTSGDEIDKVSPYEIENVAISTAATASFLSNTSIQDARELLSLLEIRAYERLRTEIQNSQHELNSNNSSPDLEKRIIRAWQRWYQQAFESIADLPISGQDDELGDAISQAKAALDVFIQKQKKSLNYPFDD